jgi:HEAT repeat protein
LAARLQDVQPAVRAAAALALAHLHARDAASVTPWLDAVAGLLEDEEGYVRQAAADSLALCGDDGVPPLGSVLRYSTHQGARTRAAGALRKIATMPAAAILYALLNDQNHLVRAYAYEGLDEMGLLENVLVIPA